MKLKTLKIINLFRSFFLTISFIFFFYFNSLSLTVVETPIALDAAWGMTWIDDEQMLITQKSGEIFLVNTLNYSQIKILHDLPFVQYGQGGLLDIVSEGNTIWFTGSIEKEKKYTTAIFQATLSGNKLINENLIYEALPYIKSPYHFGSRIEILDDYLYVSIGERGEGMIAQDTSNSIGSIIRIHKNGDIPDDNPYQNDASWRPELYQIGVRNPQGMSLDPLSQKVFISNHGPKGGDFIGPIIAGSNYGWKQIAWGGKNYSGTKVGEGNTWEPGLLQPDHIWVPSIGVGGIKFYTGDLFPEFKNSLLIGSLKFQYLSYLPRDEDRFGKEKIIFKNLIGRVRDIEVNSKGEIFLIADEGDTTLYKLTN